jgi:acyl-CoA thioesterase-1
VTHPTSSNKEQYNILHYSTLQLLIMTWLVCSLLLASLSSRALASNGTKALRICRPSPPVPDAADSSPACLVIGDSVSLGYTTPLTGNLTGICDVLHAPYSGDGGACDTRYGLQCADLWLGSTLGGAAAPKYEVIVFNFGLHDTNDSGKVSPAFFPIGSS